jgi:MFS family permease
MRPFKWYHGWNIVGVCMLSQAAATALPINGFSLFLSQWAADLKAPVSTLQLAIAALGVCGALISPLVGTLADKLPARWLMAGGSLGVAIFYIWVSFVTTSTQLLTMYVLLYPVSLTLSTALLANTVISRWFARRLGLALGLSAFGLGIAGVVLPPTVATLLPLFGWRTMWRVAGVLIALIVVPVLLFVVRDRPRQSDGGRYIDIDKSDEGSDARGHSVSSGVPLRWGEILARRNLQLLAVVSISIMGLFGGCGYNLALIAAGRGETQRLAGMLLAGFSFAQVSATLLAGVLSDRVGNRLPLAALAATAAVGALIVAFGHTTDSLAVGGLLVGLGGGMWTLLPAAVAREFGANNVGRAYGTLMLFLPIIGGFAPYAVAKAQEVTHSYVPSLLTLSVLGFVGAGVCLCIKEQGREPTAPVMAPTSASTRA